MTKDDGGVWSWMTSSKKLNFRGKIEKISVFEIQFTVLQISQLMAALHNFRVKGRPNLLRSTCPLALFALNQIL